MNEYNTSTYLPLVSIVIPVFNGSKYLPSAIDSALAQLYPNIEIIVVNDGSLDHGATKEICHRYGEKIRYFEKENGGVSSALNLGIAKMRGQYFSWLSHDDMYLPEKINRQIDFISLNSNIDICYCGVLVLDDASQILQRCKSGECNSDETFSRLLVGNFINGCTLLIPKYAFDKLGNFDEKLKTSQDFDLWVRFASQLKFAPIPDELVIYRKHGAQDSVQKSEIHRRECDIVHSKILRRHDAYLSRGNAALSNWFYLAMIFKLHCRGHRKSAAYAMLLAWKFNLSAFLLGIPIHLIFSTTPWIIIFSFIKLAGNLKRRLGIFSKASGIRCNYANFNIGRNICI